MEINDIISNKYYYNLLNIATKNNNILHINILKTKLKQYEDNNMSELVYSDDYMYKKSWNKLNNIHKNIKIKEYINNLSIDIDSKKKITTDLAKLVKEKKIGKNDIFYDSINTKILSIKILENNNNNYHITI